MMFHRCCLIFTTVSLDQELTDTNKEIEFEFDEYELKRYPDVVIKEVKMK